MNTFLRKKCDFVEINLEDNVDHKNERNTERIKEEKENFILCDSEQDLIADNTVNLAKIKIKDAIRHSLLVNELWDHIDSTIDSLELFDYQVAVKIYEAKLLSGLNIDPFVCIRIDDKKKSTSIQKSTNNPHFMEYFVFTFKNSPIHFLCKPLELIVKQSKGALQSSDTIGSFSLDIVLIYNQTDHQFIGKWAELIDPNTSELKGYLKVDLTIITREDISSKSIVSNNNNNNHHHHNNNHHYNYNSKDNDENVIRDNLLLPYNITSRQFVRILIKVYRADGLPRSGSNIAGTIKSLASGAKETLNPYIVVNYAGITAKTSIIKKSSCPTWNEQIAFIDSFPSFFQYIQIQIKDESITDDNLIATHYLSLDKISNPNENGFLPTFGPSFIHFYGSPRENDQLKHLNLGLETGVAYRGRLLVKIMTEFVDLIDPDIKKISIHKISPLNEQIMGSIKEFLLFAEITNSNMIPNKYSDKLISYEIGFGDPDDVDANGKLDDDDIKARSYYMPVSNSIQPIRCYTNRKDEAYYLPLNENEPLNMYLQFRYLDATRRLYHSNRLFKILRNLNNGLADVEAIKATSELNAAKRLLGVILNLEDQLKEYLKYLKNTKHPMGVSDLDKAKVSDYKASCEIFLHDISIFSSNISIANIDEICERLSELSKKLLVMSEDVETSYPDIFIFMIYSRKRIAYARLPTKDYIYSENCKIESGINCNRKIPILLRALDKSANKIRNKIEIRIWFGCLDSNESIKQNLFQKLKKDKQTFSFRAHIYQARSLIACDSSGLSDPYVKLYYNNVLLSTHYVPESLSPVWDEVLYFNDMIIYGSKESIKSCEQWIIIELYDHDKMESDDFMGKCIIPFNVIRFSDELYTPPKLSWFDLWRSGEHSGQLLASFELVQINSNDLDEYPKSLPISRHVNHDKIEIISIPKSIRPVLSKFRLQILFWGIRNIKKMLVCKPRIDVECAGRILSSSVINNFDKSLNFIEALKEIELNLPNQEIYCPPITISLIDCKSFGRYSLIGTHVVNSLFKYIHKNNDKIVKQDKRTQIINGKTLLLHQNVKNKKTCKRKPKEEVIDMLEENTETELEIDWWTRYYLSKFNQNFSIEKNDTLEKMRFRFYNHEIEKSSEFSNDLQSFVIKTGKVNKLSEQRLVGVFKGGIHLSRCSSSVNISPLEYFPANDPVRLFVRIYLIRALDIKPVDSNGKADLYPIFYTSKQKLNDKANYIPNQLNPIFGRIYEMEIGLPHESFLTIALKDRDLIGSNDLIGVTKIDLEQRFYSKHRFTCGLPKYYEISGPNKWRDSIKPTQILTKICRDLKMSDLIITQNFIRLGNIKFILEDNSSQEITEEHLALSILNRWNEIFDYTLVQEHVETRSLYHPDRPYIRRGKIELWIDIFRADEARASPINIQPRTPKPYELRIIIFNTRDVILDDKNLLTGEKMSDIYVKGWLTDINRSQQTDIHYRSLTGEGNFNWRFIFHFYYLPTEKVIIIKRKDGFFSLDETEHKIPCKINLEIWDADSFSSDDFLGCLELCLIDFPKGARNHKLCDLSILEDNKSKRVNLFKEKRLKGWWPFYSFNEDNKKNELTGKLEAEFELLTEEESHDRPAGLGRSEPLALDKPNRPDTSFIWFLNPLKSFKYILWKNHKATFFKLLLFIFLLLFLTMFIYSLPGYTVKKLLGA